MPWWNLNLIIFIKKSYFTKLFVLFSLHHPPLPILRLSSLARNPPPPPPFHLNSKSPTTLNRRRLENPTNPIDENPAKPIDGTLQRESNLRCFPRRTGNYSISQNSELAHSAEDFSSEIGYEKPKNRTLRNHESQLRLFFLVGACHCRRPHSLTLSSVVASGFVPIPHVVLDSRQFLQFFFSSCRSGLPSPLKLVQSFQLGKRGRVADWNSLSTSAA
ncbi:unnamed protein product [Linum tenue]|uniref:Uncharacterized protein n=1 Tax=Linum tenue TaxID=586396 RepID=A0AAV0JD03_9ROSI|nr:unnamed protein product [Linum tenue]